MDKDYTDPLLIKRARELRTERPEVEAILWSRLRAKQLRVKFRRQHPIGPFITDFACVEKKLIVELDGQSHDGRHAEDETRTAHLRSLDWRVVRYWNMDVIDHLDDVVADIRRNLTLAAPT